MKNQVYILAALLVLSGSAGAEAEIHGGGIKGGLLVSSPAGEREEYDVESVNTAGYGVYYRYSFENKYSLQAELIYSPKGSKGAYYTRSGEIRISYVDIIAPVHYRVLEKNSLFSDLYLGPVFGIYLSGEVEREDGKTYGIGSDIIKPFDLGFCIGAKFGISHAAGHNETSVDLRYSMGFIAPDDTGQDIDLRNRTVSVMLEIYFDIGR
ncbi:MAG: porin family protein [Candidatus Krumholzibacteriales bacterium]